MKKEGEKLWKKYCSFLDKPFSEQVEYNGLKLKEYFKRWKQTKMAKQLCPKGVKRFEDVPLTTYDDYPILHEFGKKIEHLSKTVPRKKGELLWDYYDRISRQVAPMLDEWMTDKYCFCVKTSGTSGKSKWFAHGDGVWKNTTLAVGASAVFACSDERGKTKIKKGDRILNTVASPPYASGYMAKMWSTTFKCVPPTQIIENITDMRKKFSITLDTIKKERIDFLPGIPSTLYLITQYFTEPEKLFKDQYQSKNFGIVKFLLFLKYLQTKISGKKYERASEILPVKGLGTSGFDGKMYLDYLKEQFGTEPLNIYAVSDVGFPMFGRPDKKFDLFPYLMAFYFEFLTKDGKIKGITELKKGQVYELVLTPFGSLPIRYKVDDLVRVISFQDDGMPIFSFEGRRIDMLDIYGYFRLSEDMVKKALKKVGLTATDNWVVVKQMHPNEHLLFLMEREWEHSEDAATKLIFDALKETNPEFKNYVDDFKIKNVSEAIKIEYLRKGSFMRYTTRKAKEGALVGQIKPPKMLPPDKIEIATLLRSI